MIMMRDKGTKVYRANITHHVSGVARGRHFTRALPSREVANARDEEADVRPQRVGEADELLLRVEDLDGHGEGAVERLGKLAHLCLGPLEALRHEVDGLVLGD